MKALFASRLSKTAIGHKMVSEYEKYNHDIFLGSIKSNGQIQHQKGRKRYTLKINYKY